MMFLADINCLLKNAVKFVMFSQLGDMNIAKQYQSASVVLDANCKIHQESKYKRINWVELPN